MMGGLGLNDYAALLFDIFIARRGSEAEAEHVKEQRDEMQREIDMAKARAGR